MKSHKSRTFAIFISKTEVCGFHMQYEYFNWLYIPSSLCPVENLHLVVIGAFRLSQET